jgi:anti-sigma factor RsiW
MNPIDTQIKEYYQKQPLSEDQLRALRPPEDSPATRPWLLPFAAAATAAAVVLAIFILKPVGLTEAVVTEIAKNHSAHHPMEIRSSDYGEVAAALDRIQFPLTPPDEEFRRQYTLVGGRYCSIRNKRAAQLRVRKNSTGQMHTLYITKLTDELRALPETTRTIDGVQVRLWNDGKCLFGLASR